MKNYTEQQSGIFCPGQTFPIGSESDAVLSIDLYQLHITGTADLISHIIEFKYFKKSTQSLENDSN